MKLFFYPFTVNFNKCSGTCNTTDALYVRVFVLDKVEEHVNVKLFNFISWVNEKVFLFKHELCECNFRLNGNVGESKKKKKIIINFNVSVKN